MTQFVGLLMAGGTGTRFWPDSRRARPKQLLPIGTELPLLEAASKRLQPLIPPERQLVVTSAAIAPAVRALLPALPPEHVVGEPAGRDTAPCIGLAALLAARIDPDAVAVALPSDHVIAPEDAFREHLEVAAEALAEHPESLLVFGIEPDRAATGYGYLRRGEAVGSFRGKSVYALDAFVEKPDLPRAEDMLAEGGHSWNAGMFAFRPAALLAAYAEHLPELVDDLQRLAAAWRGPDFEALMDEVFPTLPKVSIDYGIMEKVQGTLMLPLPLSWDDVGTWGSLARLLQPDSDGNYIRGDAQLLGVSGCIVSATDGVVAIKGVDDLIVVHTPDATLVCRRDDDQGVKQIVEALAARGMLRYL
ncbi:MAG: mannose-1-phosphate guanyltransferase [Planctomycetota bacterium]|nr:MAG: mannose-1-phosphate guanyltransferase [Planctomycetota bacterium]